MAFDASGNLFVTDVCAGDVGCGTIFKFAPNGVKTPFSFGMNFETLAFDNFGNLFAANNPPAGGGGLFKFSPNGVRSVFSAQPQIISPNGIAFDTAGNLFVADTSP
jgi:streptogramin lyase